MASRSLDDLEAAMGVRFDQSRLLREALTHSSFSNENPEADVPPNERLEFLGDAILDHLTAEYLFRRFPEMREGEMTALRAALVKTTSLASFAKRWEVGEYMFFGHGEEANGGRSRLANLCAAFEALVGAVYLDQGLEVVQRVIEPLVEHSVDGLIAKGSHIRAEGAFLVKDAKSHLQEISQSLFHLTPSYRTVDESGPDHEKVFTVEVLVGTVPRGIGVGRSKQAAEQAAARDALAGLPIQTDREA